MTHGSHYGRERERGERFQSVWERKPQQNDWLNCRSGGVRPESLRSNEVNVMCGRCKRIDSSGYYSLSDVGDHKRSFSLVECAQRCTCIGELTRTKRPELQADRLKVIVLCILGGKKTQFLLENKFICTPLHCLMAKNKIRFASMYRQTNDVRINPDMLLLDPSP